MCDTLLFIDGGKIVHHGDAESLKQGSDAKGGSYYDVQVLGDPMALANWAVTSPHVELIDERKRGGRIRVESNEAEQAAMILQRMIKDGLSVTEFHKEQRNLEDAFIDILGQIEGGKVPQITPPPLPPKAAVATAE
jgi:ABC-2 type transport system ATP-binding protein